MQKEAPDLVKTTKYKIGQMPIEKIIPIVQKLESGRAPLQESIVIYERGEALKQHCEGLLKAAEARIEKITLSRDGKPAGTESLDT